MGIRCASQIKGIPFFKFYFIPFTQECVRKHSYLFAIIFNKIGDLVGVLTISPVDTTYNV